MRKKEPRGENPTAADSKPTEKLEEIYRVAARLISEKSFAATSMNDIADAVGLTKAGLYYYIQGKKELLYSIANFAMEIIETEVFEPTRKIQNPEERLKKILSYHLNSVKHLKEIKILAGEVDSLAANHREQILHRKRDYFHYVQKTLQELKELGRLRELDVSIATTNLFSVLLAEKHWSHSNDRPSSAETAEETIQFILCGLLKPGLSSQG